MSELEELRKKRLAQLRAQQSQLLQQEYQQELQRQEVEQQIKHIINNIMTPEARERLANIRLARPDFARQVEILLIQMAQSGRLPKKIDDLLFKQILSKISEGKRETQIKRI
ncbi:MAG TPA: DNA-binding protein [Candidatus Altiarchaeales archaeon]|nr:DNA-binding protein [Candidatus Altiarchaeales archaeon]